VAKVEWFLLEGTWFPTRCEGALGGQDMYPFCACNGTSIRTTTGTKRFSAPSFIPVTFVPLCVIFYPCLSVNPYPPGRLGFFHVAFAPFSVVVERDWRFLCRPSEEEVLCSPDVCEQGPIQTLGVLTADPARDAKVIPTSPPFGDYGTVFPMHDLHLIF